MPDPLHARICLTASCYPGPVVSLFLVPEPGVRGANMLHLLEQAPVGETPRRDPELIGTLESRTLPGVRARMVVSTEEPDQAGLRTIFHDHYIHYIGDGPQGLDTGDRAEMIRLALLPEHPIGQRRIDDFEEAAVRRAMLAVYRYFGVDQRIPLMYHGYADPAGGWLAVRTAVA